MSKNSVGLRLSRFVVDKPKHALAIFIFIVAVLTPGALLIKSTYTPRMWFASDHKQITALNDFERKFGNDQKTIIGLHNPSGIFNNQTLSLIHDLTHDMWQVSEVIRVESLANHSDMTADGDDVLIAPFLGDNKKEYTVQELAEIKARALADDIIPDYYISHDATYALIFGHLKPAFEKDPDYNAIVTGTEDLIKKYEGSVPGVELYLLGDSTANEAFREVARDDNLRIMPFMFGTIILILAWLFRNTLAVVMPLLLCYSAIGVTYGLMGWIGLVYNSMLAAIPGILLAISLADAVHILMSFYHFMSEDNAPKEALVKALHKNFKPTLMTSITTSVSFMTIAWTEIIPVRDLGFMSSFGTMMAWLFTYIFVGSTLSLFHHRFKDISSKNISALVASNKKVKVFSQAKAWTSFVVRHATKIIVISAILSSTALYLSTKNVVNSDPLKYFTTDVPLRAAYDFSSKKLNGLRGVELVVDSGSPEGVKDPVFLRNLQSFERWLMSIPEITHTKSITQIISKLNRILHSNDPDFEIIPDTQEEVAGLLFLYQMGLPQGMDLNNQITLTNQELRFRILWKIETSTESTEMLNTILAKAPEFNLDVRAGGNLPIYTAVNSLIVESFFWSLIGALLFVSLLILVIFKDPLIATIAMLPNVLPMVFGGALMVLMGVYVDIGTSMVIVVCLGIAVDDTIHFIANYKHYREQGMEIPDAIEKTFSITGKALVVTTVLLVTGFGSFVFAEFVPNRTFGILCAQILIFALVIDLTLLPALLIKFRGRKKA
tara:strand:- start:1266 stop:3596 length:2331 start_codon:yes stop_codon:yes gene_type:complete